jgi:hypothetical protein
MVNAGGQDEQVASFHFNANPTVVLGVPHIEETGASHYKTDFFVSMQMFREENLQLGVHENK